MANLGVEGDILNQELMCQNVAITEVSLCLFWHDVLHLCYFNQNIRQENKVLHVPLPSSE